MLIEAILKNLIDLKSLILKLSDEDYVLKREVYSGSSIGQHVRHILEFYRCALVSLESGVVCYDHRKRDERIELSRKFACKVMKEISDRVPVIKGDFPIKLQANFSSEGEASLEIQTSLYRELAYCLEHDIHHQALIKVGLVSAGNDFLFSENFGVAPSTIRSMVITAN